MENEQTESVESVDTPDVDAADTEQSDQSPETTEGDHDNQDSEDTTDDLPRIKVGNRELTPDQLVRENEEARKKYTESRQELAQIRKELEDIKKQGATSSEAARAVEDATSQLDPDVRAAVVKAVLPEVEKLLESRDTVKTRQRELDESFSQLSDKWDGKDGKPHFDADQRQELLDRMSMPGNKIFDPVTFWEHENYAEIEDWIRKDAIRNHRKAAPKPETPSGGLGEKKPTGANAPTTIEEAGERARSRFR